jgi:purine-binding chemotaxis protein CheW
MEKTSKAMTVQVPARQVVSFSLDREEFGVDILKVQEIVKLQKIARVPQSPGFVEGVINLRGNVIPVIDLRKKFGLQPAGRCDQTRIIVFNIQDKMLGVLVDRVQKVLRIPEDQIDAPPDVGAGGRHAFITGIGKLGEDLITLVDIETMLSGQELHDLNDIEKAKAAVQDLTGTGRPADPESVRPIPGEPAIGAPAARKSKKLKR